MGWTMAVLVEIVMLPLESVEVTGTGIATGVVGRVVTAAGEGAMTMLLDTAAKGITAGTMLDGCWRTEALGRLLCGFPSAGAETGSNACGGTAGAPSKGASVGVGPSSSSVEMDVVVRYNAPCNANGPWNALGPP